MVVVPTYKAMFRVCAFVNYNINPPFSIIVISLMLSSIIHYSVTNFYFSLSKIDYRSRNHTQQFLTQPLSFFFIYLEYVV